MRISTDKKFIYIAVPRSGSTSVRVALDDYSDIKSTHITQSPTFHHLTYKESLKLYPQVNDYKKIIIMRNPLERALSLYIHHLDNLPEGIFKKLDNLNRPFALTLFWIRKAIFGGRLIAPASYYIEGGQFKIFSLQDKLLSQKVSNYLNIKKFDFPSTNHGSVKLQQRKIPFIARTIIKLMYRKDIKLFNKIEK